MEDNMSWIIDRIENNMAILENEQTKEKQEVAISLLPANIHEGAILTLVNHQYLLNKQLEDKKRLEIEKRFRNLRSKD